MDPPTSTTTDPTRKNGKPASCEPCRKAKVRCDHSRPTCARCRRRGLTSQCYYHPAPLTRERIVVDQPASPCSIAPISTYSPKPMPATPPNRYSHDRHTKAAKSIKKLLAQLVEDIALIYDLIQKYYSVSSLYALVPSELLIPATEDLQARLQASHDQGALLEELSEGILASVHDPVVLDSQTTPSAFISQLRGRSMRIEMLGIIYTVAARAALFDYVQLLENKAAFVQKMYHCSNKAVSWARRHLPRATDTFIWLAYQNLLLTTQIHGDASLASWRCLGELISDLLTMHMHRESSYTSLPFFIAQIRRRALALTYNLDKSMASLVGCPPRLLKRYIDCEMPLDLMEPELLLEPPLSHEQLQALVREDGWSREARHTASMHARVRFMLATFREEVLDHDYQALTKDSVQTLSNLLERSHEAWNALPAHLRYCGDCWSSGLSKIRCLMLTTTYLSYRNLALHIYRLLEKIDSSFSSSTLEVANDLVDVVLQLASVRTRASFISHDFAYIVMAHGVPPALQLAAALADHRKTLPPSLKRSALIRNLSVFVAALESLHDLGEMDTATVSKTVETISSVLEDVLSASESRGDTATSLDTSSSPSGILATPDSMQLDRFTTNFNFSSNGMIFDGSTWMDDLEWTNFSNDWIKF